MFQDYATTGFSLRSHPLHYIRQQLSKHGASPIEKLSSRFGITASSRVSAAGIVITRQRPGTAKGVVFLTIEDETGTCNLIIRPNIFDLHHKTIMYSQIVLAAGALQRIGDVVYIDVTHICSLDNRFPRDPAHC
jgi:error-prone DNA polymerase